MKMKIDCIAMHSTNSKPSLLAIKTAVVSRI